MTIVMIITCTSYTLILLFSYLIRRHIRRMAVNYSFNAELLAKREREVTRVLVLQALFPALTASMVTFMFGSMMVNDAGEHLASVSVYITLSMAWTPIANSSVTLAMVKPYREWVVGGLRRMLELKGRELGRIETTVASGPVPVVTV